MPIVSWERRIALHPTAADNRSPAQVPHCHCASAGLIGSAPGDTAAAGRPGVPLQPSTPPITATTRLGPSYSLI